MIIKTKKIKQFKLTLNEDELDALALAATLMLLNEHTHQNWKDKLEPMVGEMRFRLGLDEDYNI